MGFSNASALADTYNEHPFHNCPSPGEWATIDIGDTVAFNVDSGLF